MKEYEKFWDEISSIEEIDYDDEKVNRLLRWKAIHENLQGVKKILDVGAATGAFSIPLAKMGYEVTHFDFSPEMISYAKSNAEGVDNICFKMGDATNLCMFEDCEFDLVLCFDGVISFSGKDANKVIENCCRVGKKVMLTVSSKACMGVTWLNYSLNTFGKIHPSVMEMMKTGYFSKKKYEDSDEMTGIMELKAYDVPELSEVLKENGMKVIECRSIGSLTHLYLLHLYRQHNKIEVHEIINDISMKEEFVELCDYYDKHVMSDGMGSFRRAGILAVAEHELSDE